MKKKFISLIISIFICITPLVGPVYAKTNTDSLSIVNIAEQKLEVYVRLLCSDIFAGRKPGSFGNDLTVGWLSRMLDDIGIAPYESDYRMGFNTRCYTHQQLVMTVYEKDGKVHTLIPGKDFYISLTASFDVTITKDDISLISIGDTAKRENSNYVFEEVHAFHAGSFVEKKTPQSIQVTNDTFSYLTEAEIDYIHIVNNVAMEQKEVYNVVGIIPGTKSDKAVILSAHFDHMGQLGESIFRGAMDNASGTAALLHIAEVLFQMSCENPFDFDIIIAFCNDEENGLTGSAYLAPLLKEAYVSLFNMNLDCVGIGDSDNVYVLSDSAYQTLTDEIKIYLDIYDISYNDDDSTITYLASDGISFERNGIPSISFINAFVGGEVIVDYYHTTSDTPDKLDYSQMANLCRMIIAFTTYNGSQLYDGRTASRTNIILLPDNVDLKFSEVVNKVKMGEEAYFDEEMISYMPGGNLGLYTYDQYLQISESISMLREYNDYHLAFIEKPTTLPITRLIYVRDVPLPEPNAVQISLATYFTHNAYKSTAIEGMDGYYSVSYFSSPDMIIGFIYDGDDRRYFFEIGYLVRSSNYVHLMISPSGPNIPSAILNLDHLKTLIEEFNIEMFIEMWKEYNLNQ